MLAVFAAVGIIGVLILLLGPHAHWATVDETELKGKEKADAVNATRQTLLAAAGGTAVVFGLGLPPKPTTCPDEVNSRNATPKP